MADLNGYYSSLSNLTTAKDHSSSLIIMERGPRYNAYAALRESKLRMKNNNNSHQHHETGLTPPTKQVKFQPNFGPTPTRRKGLSSPSILAQSVPDFSAALRKENKKPTMMMLPPVSEKSMTPPSKSGSNGRMVYGKMMSDGGGSKSANNSGEKRGGGIMGRKSYANLEELKSFSSLAGNAIVNGSGSGRVGIGRKTILGTKHFF